MQIILTKNTNSLVHRSRFLITKPQLYIPHRHYIPFKNIFKSLLMSDQSPSPSPSDSLSYTTLHENLPSHFLGGNSVLNAEPSKVRDFVRAHQGHTVISKILIANNGIAAVKEIRSVRKWAYETFGDEKPYSLPLWPLQKIWKLMPNILEWPTNSLKSLVAPITITMLMLISL